MARLSSTFHDPADNGPELMAKINVNSWMAFEIGFAISNERK